jgi:hypothetical protein
LKRWNVAQQQATESVKPGGKTLAKRHGNSIALLAKVKIRGSGMHESTNEVGHVIQRDPLPQQHKNSQHAPQVLQHLPLYCHSGIVLTSSLLHEPRLHGRVLHCECPRCHNTRQNVAK